MSAIDLAILLASADAEADQIAMRARKLTTRPVSVHVAEPRASETPGRARNHLIQASESRFILFWSEPKLGPTTFLEHAMRTFERLPNVAFITSWQNGVPQRGERPSQPISIAELWGRPWFVHAPTLFRRELWHELGGFDEQLPGLEDLDFWLRALDAGKVGHAIEEPGIAGNPWGSSLSADAPGARETARRLFERHSPSIQSDWVEIVLNKERVVRELFAVHRQAELRAQNLREKARLLARAERRG